MNLGSGGVSRSLQATADSSRELLTTVFTHTTWNKVWESIFTAERVFSAPPAVVLDPANYVDRVGYYITLFHCPGDGYQQGFDTQFDPEHAFYDAAALLKYSIEKNAHPNGSKYKATMHAIIHPEALRCVGRNGNEYDRGAVLQELGYNVAILGEPMKNTMISNDYVRENIDGDAGIRDFLRLRATNFDIYPLVVLIDFRTFVVQQNDIFFDLFLASDKIISFPTQYPTKPPSHGSNTGASLNYVAIKPSATMMDEILASYQSTIYDLTWGWAYQGVRDFEGVLGVSGYLLHYFTRVKPGAIFQLLNVCEYANDGENPKFINSDGVEECRTPECTDCRTFGLDKIFAYKMDEVCGAPWECKYDANWPDITKTACERSHKFWFENRHEYEQQVWVNGPPPDKNGAYHPEIFLGYCECEGPTCYEVMINDQP